MISSPSSVAVRGDWINSQALPQTGFTYVSAKWVSPTTCVIVGNTSQLSSVLRSTDTGRTWTDVTNNDGMQGFLLTDIAAGMSNVYVITGRNLDKYTSNDVVDTTSNGKTFDHNNAYIPNPSSPNGVVYTSKDGINFSNAKGLNGLVSPGAGLNGAAVGSPRNVNDYAFVVGVAGKIYKSTLDLYHQDFIDWQDVSLKTTTVMRSNKCCTTFYLTYE